TGMLMMYKERVDLRGMLRRMVGHPKKQPEAYERRDALKMIYEDSPPILIVPGYEDSQVGIEMAYHLEQPLIKATSSHKTKYKQGAGHVIRPQTEKETLSALQHWMNLCKQKTEP